MQALRDAAVVRLTILGTAGLLAGCSGLQSTFSPFGAEAASIRTLAIIMFTAAALLAVGVLALAWHAVRKDDGIDYHGGMRMILWLGAIGPTLLLTALLAAALPQMRPLPTSDDDLEIAVAGEQFWWRVVYSPPGMEPIETANEIRVPVGRTVRFLLASPDVIHSFWIPGLAGKLDLIPGRTNELVAVATKPGVYRGVCAEFCGLSHALMAFDVVAMEPADFDAWLEDIAQPATDVAPAGRELFDEYGCPGCHLVRGHFDGAPIGPDLTHVGSRRSIAAGSLPATVEAVARFIKDPAAVKPGVTMPSFEQMPAEDAAAIAAYLLELD